MAFYRIPMLAGAPQKITTRFAGVDYQLTFLYRNLPEAGWVMDIRDIPGNDVLLGCPLVTGLNLLAQYEYLGLGVELYVWTSGDSLKVPAFRDLGVDTFLYLWVD